MSDDCIICGKWPENDRWALQKMTTALPLPEIVGVCDEYLVAFRSNQKTRVPAFQMPS